MGEFHGSASNHQTRKVVWINKPAGTLLVTGNLRTKAQSLCYQVSHEEVLVSKDFTGDKKVYQCNF